MPDRAPPSGGPPVVRRRRRALPPPAAGRVVDWVPARIAKALDDRQRYTYVQPRVVARSAMPHAEVAGSAPAAGWCVLSPNCSRKVDADGGEIPIAWFEPASDADSGVHGRWHLHAFDHDQQRWQCTARGLALADALARVLQDPDRQFWP